MQDRLVIVSMTQSTWGLKKSLGHVVIMLWRSALLTKHLNARNFVLFRSWVRFNRLRIDGKLSHKTNTSRYQVVVMYRLQPVEIMSVPFGSLLHTLFKQLWRRNTMVLLTVIIIPFAPDNIVKGGSLNGRFIHSQ